MRKADTDIVNDARLNPGGNVSGWLNYGRQFRLCHHISDRGKIGLCRGSQKGHIFCHCSGLRHFNSFGLSPSALEYSISSKLASKLTLSMT
jgi:hypothetical protein